MTLTEKNELKRQNTIRFIKATEELIETEGIENISIRKIAKQAGFHNSTIYLYFKDLDYLILLTSMRYFHEYSIALENLSKKDLPLFENFMEIWTFFIESAFRHPYFFYNFFFGKYCNDLYEIITTYYSIFPEESAQYSQNIKEMYFGRNLEERCLKILVPLAGTVGFFEKKDLHIVNSIIISCFKSLLEETCKNPSQDVNIAKDQLLKIIRYTVSK